MSEIKFPCSRCGQKIACDETASGMNVNCPQCQTAVTVPDAREWQSIQPQDVFMIYRGESSDAAHLAGLVREGLQKRYFEVFADGEAAKNGQASLLSLKKIELATDVLVLFTAGFFDACQNEDDRVRQEIRHALRLGKNIVPMLDRHYSPPNALPADIAGVLVCHGGKAVPELWEGSMNQIAGLLNSQPKTFARQYRHELRKARPLAIFAGVVAAFGIIIGFACIPQVNVVSPQYPNILMVYKVTLGFLFGLNLVILVAAGLVYGLKAAGLKLLHSAASGLVLSNIACTVAYVVAVRGYGGTKIFGVPTQILVVTIVPLVLIYQLAAKRLRLLTKPN